MKKGGLNLKEEEAFVAMTSHLFLGINYTSEDVKRIPGIAVRKDEIEDYLKRFSELDPPLFASDGKYYRLTAIGEREFETKKDALERKNKY